jgi:hypothetical protein
VHWSRKETHGRRDLIPLPFEQTDLHSPKESSASPTVVPLRPEQHQAGRLVVIGASLGGVAALSELVVDLPASVASVLLVLHTGAMPASWPKSFVSGSRMGQKSITRVDSVERAGRCPARHSFLHLLCALPSPVCISPYTAKAEHAKARPKSPLSPAEAEASWASARTHAKGSGPCLLL